MKSIDHRERNFSLEPLDARRLLSVSTAGSQVIVLGTPDNDHVLVQVSPSDPARVSVNLNGSQSTYIINETTGILIDTGSGRDQVAVADDPKLAGIAVTIRGGGGNDLLLGGSGNDDIYGGTGKDRIAGGTGDDLLRGGASRDQISGGAGNDTLLGGGGDDALAGGFGDDAIAGGTGDDYLDGQDGSDLLSGGGDFDSLLGGAGNDSLAGGRGDDDLDGNTGNDDLSGGGGSDNFAAPQTGDNDVVADNTNGVDHEYTPVTIDFVPKKYRDLFHATFPNSTPLGVRVNDDHTFVMLYQYQGDGSTYHAYFTFTGSSPFENLGGVNLVRYEVAPSNLPPLTAAAFHEAHPDAVIKDVIADHDGGGKFALIRIKDADSAESKWVHQDWLDNE